MSGYFEVDIPSNGKLVVTVSGRSTVQDTESQFTAVLNKLDSEIKKIVFDLSKVDPVNNIAGRYVDLASKIQHEYQKKVLLRIPKNVAKDLDLILDGHTAKMIDGVLLEMTPSVKIGRILAASIKAAGDAALGNKTVMSCRGKVRHIGDRSVTVSLFDKEGEVVGELLRAQFPYEALEVGAIFDYKAIVVGDGTTEIKITFLAEELLSPNEILKLYAEAKASVPEDEF